MPEIEAPEPVIDVKTSVDAEADAAQVGSAVLPSGAATSATLSELLRDLPNTDNVCPEISDSEIPLGLMLLSSAIVNVLDAKNPSEPAETE